MKLSLFDNTPSHAWFIVYSDETSMMEGRQKTHTLEFWNITPCSLSEVNWRILLGVFYEPEERGKMFLRNVSW
jgi:hypothetical protein